MSVLFISEKAFCLHLLSHKVANFQKVGQIKAAFLLYVVVLCYALYLIYLGYLI